MKTCDSRTEAAGKKSVKIELAPEKTPLDTMSAKPYTVLVVDDTAANRSMMQVFLQRLGYSVTCASDGHSALEAFAESRPDMVLLDLIMPGMDGFEVTRRIRSMHNGAWTPIVIMSALNTDDDLVAGLDAGADDYLVKPISFVVFGAKMRVVERLLTMERGQRELLGRVQAISNAVIDGIVTSDENGVIQSANPAACRMFGYPDGGLTGKNVSVLTPLDEDSSSDGATECDIESSARKIIGKTRQVTGRRASGEQFMLELGLTELRLESRRLFIGVMRDITERVRVNLERRMSAARLQRYHDEQQREQDLARQVMASQIDKAGLRDARLRFSVMPAQNFSGDLVAAACSPRGRLFSLLADATGHGLVAAVSVQPVLPLFYALVARDLPLSQVVSDVNELLHQTLPVGRFVGAAMLCLAADGKSIEVWVGGVPDVLVLDPAGRVRKRFVSRHLPLGVVDSAPSVCEIETSVLERDEQIVMLSDGVVEAADAADQPFGNVRLERTFEASAPSARLDAVRGALAAHLSGAAAHDDMSLMLIDALPHPGRAVLGESVV